HAMRFAVTGPANPAPRHRRLGRSFGADGRNGWSLQVRPKFANNAIRCGGLLLADASRCPHQRRRPATTSRREGPYEAGELGFEPRQADPESHDPLFVFLCFPRPFMLISESIRIYARRPLGTCGHRLASFGAS